MKLNEPVCMGYSRDYGRPGIRNIVLVIYTVECSKDVSQRVAAHFRRMGKPVDCVGSLACLDNQVIVRRLLRYCAHPNVGAVLIIGHGCEYIDPLKLRDFAIAHGRLASAFYLQEAGGSKEGFDKAVNIVGNMLEALENTPRIPMCAKDLVVGAKCGGSDFTSGLTGNALVGRFFESLVAAGGTGMMEEIAEAVGLRNYLVSRAVDEAAARDIAMTYDKTMEFCRKLGSYSISPGNFVGGLTTIEEKSMGAVVKAGRCPIQGVLKIAQAPKRPGFWLLDVIPDYKVEPGFFQGGDATGLMDQIASGCHMLLFVTGRGHVGGTPISPVIKITGNSKTYQGLKRDIDIDASDLLTGEQTLEQMESALWQKVINVANGELSLAERAGHREGTLFFNNQYPDKVVAFNYE